MLHVPSDRAFSEYDSGGREWTSTHTHTQLFFVFSFLCFRNIPHIISDYFILHYIIFVVVVVIVVLSALSFLCLGLGCCSSSRPRRQNRMQTQIHSIQKQSLRSSVFSYTLSLALFHCTVRFLLLFLLFFFCFCFISLSFLSSVYYYYNKLLRAESLLPLWYSLRSWNFSVPFGLSETREKRTTDKKQQHKRTKRKLNQKPKPKQHTYTRTYARPFGYCASVELASAILNARAHLCSRLFIERYGVPVDGKKKESTSAPHMKIKNGRSIVKA